ncbi:hypothetical protein [Aquimarina sp. RZ0]|uniref:hypothetical protein n=1 Tax=Aquimarina sp. RZ0 TaxID=2607730 RepID=UPI0011F24945|nr:hypothetical protein [Aquimarina sp. RZ0]KAA1246745.1 hypothetical protein F0000_06815 [Aquimarina sp. RZ0]
MEKLQSRASVPTQKPMIPRAEAHNKLELKITARYGEKSDLKTSIRNKAKMELTIYLKSHTKGVSSSQLDKFIDDAQNKVDKKNNKRIKKVKR